MNAVYLKRKRFWSSETVLCLLAVVSIFLLEICPEPTLHQLSAKGSLKGLEKAVSDQLDLEALNNQGLTALACAAKAGQADAVTLLLKAGADINGKSRDGSTPLHFALQQTDPRLIADLLDAGADPYLKNQGDICPFYLAVQKNHPSIPVFLKKGAEPNDIHAKKGTGYLFCAARSGCMPVLSKTLSCEPDINRRSAQGITALLYAVHSECLEAARFLIENGADVNAGDRRGVIPLSLAVHARNLQLVRLLQENGAEQEACSTDTPAPFLLAANKLYR